MIFSRILILGKGKGVSAENTPAPQLKTRKSNRRLKAKLSSKRVEKM
jgi:hypothetical protein